MNTGYYDSDSLTSVDSMARRAEARVGKARAEKSRGALARVGEEASQTAGIWENGWGGDWTPRALAELRFWDIRVSWE
jgi:hypothetical protein